MSRETVELTVTATRDENGVIDVEIKGSGVRSVCSYRVHPHVARDEHGIRRLLGKALDGVLMTLLGAGETHDRR